MVLVEVTWQYSTGRYDTKWRVQSSAVTCYMSWQGQLEDWAQLGQMTKCLSGTLTWQHQSNQVSCLVARGTQKVLQKTGSRSYQFIKVWAWKPSNHNFCHILLVQQSQSLPRFNGRTHKSQFFLVEEVRKESVAIFNLPQIYNSQLWKTLWRMRRGCHEGNWVGDPI